MTIVSYMSRSRLVPRVNCSPRGGWPVDRSKQWPSSKRCSNSNSAATTEFTWTEQQIIAHENPRQNESILAFVAYAKHAASQYLLQVDVVQIMGAAYCLHHPALWCDHIKGEKWRFWELHETSNWAWRHCLICQESHVGLQNKTIKTVKKGQQQQRRQWETLKLDHFLSEDQNKMS